MTKYMTSWARLVPPVGGFQEIDGRRVFVYRSGSGGPAVVFLPGASAVGLDYFGVQEGVSQFTTAVVYDRGGTGYSGSLPLPRTAAAVAAELHELLRARNIAGPYVLAAHSLGGFYAHAPGLERLEQMRPVLREMYAELRADYPEYVRQPLIDAKVSDEWIHVGVAERTRLAEVATELRAGPDVPDGGGNRIRRKGAAASHPRWSGSV